MTGFMLLVMLLLLSFILISSFLSSMDNQSYLVNEIFKFPLAPIIQIGNKNDYFLVDWLQNGIRVFFAGIFRHETMEMEYKLM